MTEQLIPESAERDRGDGISTSWPAVRHPNRIGTARVCADDTFTGVAPARSTRIIPSIGPVKEREICGAM
jgi:hypothetical protein